MAYDQASSYEAPRRAYYDQHQQVPVQRQHDGYPPQQQYNNYDQSYDQRYDQPHQQYGGYEDHGYDVNQHSGQYYGNGKASNAYQHEQYGQAYPQQDYAQQDYRQEGYPHPSNGQYRPNEGYTNGHNDGYGSASQQHDPRGQQRPPRGGHSGHPNASEQSRGGYAGGNDDSANSQNRQYDPRYQQRPNRGGYPPQNRSRSQRPPPTSEQDHRGQPPHVRDHDARRGYAQQGHDPAHAPRRNDQDARNGYGARRDVQDARDRPDKKPSPPHANGGSRQAPPPAAEAKKSAMEEWKAKERARMHEAANKPKIMPQDNAFPTFGDNKKDEKGAKGHGAKNSRSSEEHARPSTSSGRNGSRPGSSKSNIQQQMSNPHVTNGDPYQHSRQARAPQPFSPIHEQSMHEHTAQDARGRGDFERNQPSQSQWVAEDQGRRPPPSRNNSAPRSRDNSNPSPASRMAPQAYVPNAQQYNERGLSTERQRVISPPQAQAPSSRPQATPQSHNVPIVEPARTVMPEPQPEIAPTEQADEYYPQESWRTGPPKKRPQAEITRKEIPPKPEVVKPQESWRTGPPTTRTQQPTGSPQPQTIQAPAVQPTLPPPQATLPVIHQAPPQVFSPPAQQPRSPVHSPTVRNFARPNVFPAAQPHDHSLDDLYDDYYGDEQSHAISVPAPPKNRDEEIEAEMPDFDSAAPGQTSGVHKRLQTADRHQNAPAEAQHPMPAISSQYVNPSVQPLPAQTHQPYEHYQESMNASQPELRNMRHDQGGGSEGFVFGVPGEEVRSQPHYDDPRQMPPRQQAMAYRPVQSVPPENMRRFQPPVDQRPMPMPMRGGPPNEYPPAQRFHPGGRGPLPPPQQRSASARPQMSHTQTGWSDPGMQRGPNGPPLRQDAYGASHHGMPRTGSLMNQQYRAPSAPPGQQPMRGIPPPGMARNGPSSGHEQQGRPSLQEERYTDPDSLPHHPAPYRPGLADQGVSQPQGSAPVRDYDNRSSTSSHRRQASDPNKPITQADLEQARLDMEAQKASPRLALRYAKKLVEASHVLASEGGRLDAKATQRNREKWLNEAYKRVKELVRNTYPDAQFYMAECYGTGEMGLAIDAKEAFALYQAAAKGGHAAAAFRTAVSCEIGPEEGGTRKDYPKAVQWYRRAAALGDVAAMYKLGIVLLRGLLGVPRNVGEAVIWLKRAAERADKDNPHALHELATLHEPTNGDPAVREKVLPDEAYALQLFKQAADLGWKRSQFRLGQAYEYGSLGLAIDNRASISWYTKGAAQGEHNAELALSGWYLTGAEGILQQSDMEAYLWARKAAQAEPPLAKAMFAMGYFTEQGIGCPKSLEEAKRWYGRAASFQFPRALERLEELKKGGKNKTMQGKLTRDKKKDDENCVVM